ALDEIVDDRLALERRLEAHGRRDVRTLAAAGPAAAVVTRLLASRLSLGAHRVDLLARAVAPVRVPVGDEALEHLAIPVETLRLVDRRRVGVEAEPVETVDDRVDRGLRRALAVRVLDPEEILAAVVARVEPRVERRADAADVEITGRARGEAGADFHGARL